MKKKKKEKLKGKRFTQKQLVKIRDRCDNAEANAKAAKKATLTTPPETPPETPPTSPD